MKQLAWPEDRLRLEGFLERTNAWMLRPLSERMAIPTFATKLLGNGVVIVALDSLLSECGLVALYCNDQVKRVGFVTLLAVHPQCRGRGLGRDLLEKALGEMRAVGMTRARLEVAVANRTAVDFYLSHGFKETMNNQSMMNTAATIFMEKALLPKDAH